MNCFIEGCDFIDLTLFNSIYNAETERIEYLRTFIYDICWQSENIITIEEKGALSTDIINCFIPFLSKVEGNKRYKTPGEFIRLSLEDAKNYFTFKKGDFITKGLVNFTLSNYERGKEFKNLQNICESGTISSVITNDFGNKYLQHWEVVAK